MRSPSRRRRSPPPPPPAGAGARPGDRASALDAAAAAREAHHPAKAYAAPRYLALIRTAIVAGGLVAGLLILYVVGWFLLAVGARDGVHDWMAAREAEGYTASAQRIEAGGFPGAVTLSIRRPALGRARPAAPVPAGVTHPGPEPWAWEADGLSLAVSPLTPSHYRIMAPGRHRLGVTLGGRPETFEGTVAALTAAVTWSDDGPRDVDLSVAQLVLQQAGGPGVAAERLDLSAARFDPPAEAQADALALRLDLEGEGLRLPRFLDLPMGHDVPHLRLRSRLLGPLAVTPGDAAWAARLAAWRDAGGVMEVDDLKIIYGPLTLSADGTLALDADLQPVGAFTARIQGFFDAVDLLREKGLIRSRAATTAKIVLGALSKKSAEGGAATVSLPVTVQDRTLFTGPVPLMRLPPLVWPGMEMPPSVPTE